MAGSPSTSVQPANDPPIPGPVAAALDRGERRFQVATRVLLGAVIAFTAGRLAPQWLTGAVEMRAWTGVLTIVVAVGLLGAAMPAASRTGRALALSMGWLGSLLGLVFVIANILHEAAPSIDEALGQYPAWGATGKSPARPALVASLVVVAMSVVTLLLDRASRVAEWISAALLALASSVGLLFTLQAATGDVRLVTTLFHSSAMSTILSVFTLLALVAAGCLARPRRLPLGPLLSTGLAPLAALGVIGLFGTAFAARQVHRQVLNTNGGVGPADLAGAAVEALALISMSGFALWYLNRLQERRAIAARQDAARETFADVMLDSAIGMAILDGNGRVRAANPALCKLLQQSPEQLVGRNIGNLDARGRDSATQRPPVMTGPVRLPLQRPDSTTAWADVTITPTRAGSSADSSELLAQFVDVTDELHARDQLLFAARHDPLTGLLNRDQVVEMLSDHLDASPSSEVLVMAIDLDNFKIVNEAFGHSVGDQVLSTTASRISKLAGTDGWAGRVGADEFVLTMLVPAGDPDAAAKATVETVMTSLEQPIDVGDFLLRVGVSVGAVVSRSATPQNPADRPSAPQPADDPLTNASAALRAAKSSGGGRWQMYDDSMRRAARARLQLLNDMNRTLEGLDDSRFLTWFQPIVNLASGAVFGYEALARWERQGVIMPAGQWIKTAEHDAAIIHGIAMQTAEDSARFAATLPAGAHISINVSGAHINSRYFAEFVARLMALATPAAPGWLSLEITETALARITKSVQRLLTELTAVGVSLWVDDFGTGYSSLTHLRDLPISGLKLDQSFVSLLDGASPQTARRIAGGVAGLARGLRLDTIAEGVETQRQAAELAQLGWQQGQGWLFGPAQAPDHLPPVSPTRPG